jgi:hypothetical protein
MTPEQEFSHNLYREVVVTSLLSQPFLKRFRLNRIEH